MQQRMGILNKRNDWTTDKFRAYWREHHGKLAAQLSGIDAYHQNHIIDSVQRGISYKRGPESVDGISQLWFKNDEAMRQAFENTLGKRLIEDESHFIGRLRIVTVEENVVVPPPTFAVAIKRMSFLRRRPDISPEKFAYEWREVHGPLVKKLPGVLGYRQNLITHRQVPKGNIVGYDEMPIDGIVELWFENPQILDAAFSSHRGVETMDHASTFIEEITTFLVEPVVVI